VLPQCPTGYNPVAQAALSTRPAGVSALLVSRCRRTQDFIHFAVTDALVSAESAELPVGNFLKLPLRAGTGPHGSEPAPPLRKHLVARSNIQSSRRRLRIHQHIEADNSPSIPRLNLTTSHACVRLIPMAGDMIQYLVVSA
jgi:hypothetical protein